MSDFTMKILVLGIVQTNTYIISENASKEAIVFDPADNALRIEQYLKTNNLVCKGILLTHGHFDHIIAAEELSNITNAPIYAHEEESRLLSDPRMNASSQINRECSLVPDVLLKDNDKLQLAGFTLQVIHTPGHTSGGVCYYFAEQKILVSGDTLFYESIGRTDLPTGNGRVLIKAVKDKLLQLEDQVIVYPGHGKPTTIGHERINNYYLKDNMDLFD